MFVVVAAKSFFGCQSHTVKKAERSYQLKKIWGWIGSDSKNRTQRLISGAQRIPEGA